MARRLALPLFEDAAGSTPAPSLEAARRRLGGPSRGGERTGAVVRLIDARSGKPVVGIVLDGDARELSVLVGGQTVQRTRPELTCPADLAEADAALLADVRVFASLAAGQRVLYGDASGSGEGVLVEKCRYGGLVAKDDGKILAVGFRKLWPAARATA